MSIELIGIAAVGAALSKPGSALIEKASEAVGGLCAPWQIERVRKAEAKGEAAAALIKATSDIETTELHQRAVRRLIWEEAQQQKNMEGILTKAIPKLNEKAKPESMENDWVANFFDKSRIVSDNEMQDLWARILAGEANAPGTYAKRTVNLLLDLDKNEAELFTKLCGFVWAVEGEAPAPLVFDQTAEIYKRNGLDFISLNHLDSIGLIHYGGLESIAINELPKRFTVAYYDRTLALEMSKDADNDLGIGHVMFTRIGMELAPICEGKPVDGFWEYVKDYWKEYVPKSETE